MDMTKILEQDSNEKITCIMPCILIEKAASTDVWREAVNLDAVTRLKACLHSFINKFNQDDLHEFLLICPERECTAIEDILRSITQDKKYKVIAENTLIPNIKNFTNEKLGIAGWYIQQAVKLAAHKIVQTKHYIVFDSDVLCIKNCSYQDFLIDGRPALNIEKKSDFSRLYKKEFVERECAIKRIRYTKSAELLGYKHNLDSLDYFLGETPVILDTQNIKALLARLEHQHNRAWFDVLADNTGWTEYGLYFAFLSETNSLDKIHSLVHCNYILDFERSIWHSSDSYNSPRKYDYQHFFNNSSNSGFFIVIQSWLNSEDWLSSNYKSKQSFYDEMSLWIA